MVVFEDVTKDADELFTRGFVHDKPWSLELKHRRDKPLIIGTAALNPNGSIACNSTSSFTSESGLALKGIAGVDGSTIVQATYPTKFLPGMILTCKAKLRVLGKNNAVTGAELISDFHRSNYHLRGSLFPQTSKWKAQACASSCFRDSLVMLRHELSGTKTDEITGSAALCVKRSIRNSNLIGNLRIHPSSKQSMGKLVASIIADSNASTGSSMGAQLSVNVGEEKSEMTIAGNWVLDPKTRATIIKAKLDHEGKIAAAVNQRVSDTINLTVGVQFDATKKLVSEHGSQSATTIGLKLNLLA